MFNVSLVDSKQYIVNELVGGNVLFFSHCVMFVDALL